MNVTSKISIQRLDGERWFRRKPIVEIRSTEPEHYGSHAKNYICLYIRISGFEVRFDLCPNELRKAIENALNR